MTFLLVHMYINSYKTSDNNNMIWLTFAQSPTHYDNAYACLLNQVINNVIHANKTNNK